MSYFSLVQLRRDSPQAQRQLRELSGHGDAYRDHCLIWKLFPAEGYERDFVFRRRQHSGRLSYYVVSNRPPQFDSVLFRVQTKPYQPQLAAGEWVRFELEANPTVSRKHGAAQAGGRQRSTRHDVLMDAKQSCRQAHSATGAHDAMEEAALAWLLDRAPCWGLQVQGESVLTNAYTQHRLNSAGRRIGFSSLDYCGVAKVVDPNLLLKALLHGVGHARAFGCGLLLVRRME